MTEARHSYRGKQVGNYVGDETVMNEMPLSAREYRTGPSGDGVGNVPVIAVDLTQKSTSGAVQ
jgi:hypothetical protein